MAVRSAYTLAAFLLVALLVRCHPAPFQDDRHDSQSHTTWTYQRRHFHSMQTMRSLKTLFTNLHWHLVHLVGPVVKLFSKAKWGKGRCQHPEQVLLPRRQPVEDLQPLTKKAGGPGQAESWPKGYMPTTPCTPMAATRGPLWNPASQTPFRVAVVWTLQEGVASRWL